MNKLEEYKKVTKEYITAHEKYWLKFGGPIIKLTSDSYNEMKRMWSEFVVARERWLKLFKFPEK